jgi:hypothetical protein
MSQPAASEARGTVAADYVGCAATDAARAIRRAGLRPKLERSLGSEPGTYGQVVGQEPAGGEAIGGDQTVLLRVAAPGAPVAQPSPAADTRDVRDAAARSARVAVSTTTAGNQSRTLDVSEERLDLLAGALFAQPHGRPVQRGLGEIAARLRHQRRRADSPPPPQPQEATPMTKTERAAMPQIPDYRGKGLVFAVLAGVLLGAVIVAFLPHAGSHALNAAGAFNGTPISGVQTFVDKLKGNLVWLGGTAMGLVIAVVGIMFMAGHSRAHDLAIRTIAGLAILASISGIVA